ncbi:MAG: M20/M25/M40 family metallo-hydrolase [Dehalococcoidia bacterium]|nr:M20/M25/M40 family metallo-hydrolase [Dehalococcoidia bacterium]
MNDSIDWDGAAREATELLAEYLRIDTSNPPGNEAIAVDFLARILAKEGVAFEVAESAPGRSNLIARLGPTERVVTLLNHTDVVPVERQYWDMDPFGGEVRDGFLYGRGTLDMKSMGIIELMTLVLLKRQRVPLRRGLAFLAAADEEAGSDFGVSWLAEHRPDWLTSDLVINEGAYGLSQKDGAGYVFQVAVSEKSPVWVELTVTGRPGHGSVPHPDNCAEHLVRALTRVANWNQELRMTPLMRAHLDAMTKAGFAPAMDDTGALRAAGRAPGLRARLGNSISLTTVETGIKVNVIPAVARATLDCRLLPDVRPEAFLAELKAVIDDDRVSVRVLNRLYEGAGSPFDGEFVRVVREVITELVEGAHLAPELTTGFTDSRIYRLRGVPAYGFMPCLVDPEDLAGIHGHNERISLENLRLGMQVLYEVVRRLCA